MKKGMLLLLLAMLLPAGALQGGEAAAVSPSMDALERKLELGRHQVLAALKTDNSNTLSEFTTDGCSGGLSAGWQYLAAKVDKVQAIHGPHPPWESCCISHDRAYHQGGERMADAASSFAARKESDLALKACVLETGVQRAPELSGAYNITEKEVALIYTAIADLMYRAVRIGGMPCTGLPWRWGYGWPECDEQSGQVER